MNEVHRLPGIYTVYSVHPNSLRFNSIVAFYSAAFFQLLIDRTYYMRMSVRRYLLFFFFQSYPCTFQFCVLCQKNVHSSKLPCHIRQCHVAKPMFQCPACDFTSTYSKNNVKSHMVSLHGLAVSIFFPFNNLFLVLEFLFVSQTFTLRPNNTA
ncbi:unnamed protein product [Toxocara canis]|uniref:C2H2-type domain-containing protein n=1 Tax=Toxocara canis TaxID=6265 RepID=A0A183U6W8_TOXCA|nr:unnamed protein product [Toxocara canis]